MTSLLKKIFPSHNDRELQRLNKIVLKINAHEAGLSSLSDSDLKAKTLEFKSRLAQGSSLDDLLPEAFAVVREASKRVLGLRHFDVQLLGGMVLHSGKIAEMRTGEGKTLVATLAAYLNALSGQGVHVITVNDYLAERDANWMRPLYEYLGLTVGVVISGQSEEGKRAAYAADITHGTNNEFGFDYLRDNKVHTLSDKVQRELNFAVVDEVDSILIDEARTPLIISGSVDESADFYGAVDKIVKQLTEQKEKDGPGDYSIDLKAKQISLTEAGHKHIEELLQAADLIASSEHLYASHSFLMYYISAALKANYLFHCDIDYIIQNGEVAIVDEFTGRVMVGRRWSEGIHQAIEAKEKVAVQKENQTLASITFQNYFRLYNKLSGMTGTADTEAPEFLNIYNLKVIVLPPNRTMQRRDEQDRFYIDKPFKFKAIVEDVKKSLERGNPVLVGTVSIENSELMSELLKKENIAHQVLNAKHHEQEARIIAQAGRPRAVTIATNMAGRGTDIVLGGNPDYEIQELNNPTPEQIEKIRAAWKERHQKVLEAGGLRIIGTERHESRRIDNQLRGRAGRQGDPGSSCFYIAVDDPLMKIFGGNRLQPILAKLGMKNGEELSSGLLSSSIEKAQRKVESHNFDIRKNLMDYDDVPNRQRKVVYGLRNDILADQPLYSAVEDYLDDVLDRVFDSFIPPETLEEEWRVPEFEQSLMTDFGVHVEIAAWLREQDDRIASALKNFIREALHAAYMKHKAEITPIVMDKIERSVMLNVLDKHWLDHLSSMDRLRQGIHLRGYGQKDPKMEYRRESFSMFEAMLDAWKYDVVTQCFRARAIDPRLMSEDAYPEEEETHHEDLEVDDWIPDESASPISRNSVCPCGSGEKYKHCHGVL